MHDILECAVAFVHYAKHQRSEFCYRIKRTVINDNTISLIYSNNLFFPALDLIGRPEGLESTGSSTFIFDLLESDELFFLFFFPLFFSSFFFFGSKSSIVKVFKFDMDWIE